MMVTVDSGGTRDFQPRMPIRLALKLFVEQLDHARKTRIAKRNAGGELKLSHGPGGWLDSYRPVLAAATQRTDIARDIWQAR